MKTLNVKSSKKKKKQQPLNWQSSRRFSYFFLALFKFSIRNRLNSVDRKIVDKKKNYVYLLFVFFFVLFFLLI